MTQRDLHERASALFLRLRELPREERARALQDEAGSDPGLAREVASLLENDIAEEVTAEGRAPAAGVPARIGPYAVIRRLGHGGSGYVLLAEQTEPVHRKVAIKIVPYAAVNPEFAARFEFERRALERTEHPNIARILDAGQTADGLPYLVMDYVEGVPLGQYCREHKLGIRERIPLVLDVADAVQHAHQRGVIHRDLKPANILVSEVSGRPTPRVLDFGIAKPIEGAFASEGQTPATSGMPMGTPAYMAPEQTGGRAIDTRADVYAIGAVLYELASGRPPIDTKGDTIDALRRIRDEIPVPASRARSQNRDLDDDPVSGSFLADLDCILAKALDKRPEARYQTVAAMGEDLRRMLRSEPIEAHPPTIRYRAVRFAQRNRVLAGTLAVGVLAVAVGLGGLTGGLIEARRQKREAALQFETQLEINKFLTDDLLAATSPDQAGQNVSALDLLRRAALRVDERFATRPKIAASIHHTLGIAYSELGAYADAQTHLDKAVALRRTETGVDAPETMRTEIALASLLVRRDKLPEGVEALTRVIPRARLILGPDDPALYSAMNDLGVAYDSLGKPKQAVPLLQEALAGRVRILGEHDPQVLATTNNLALAYGTMGDAEQSLRLLINALHIAEGLAEPPTFTILGLNNNIGATYQDLHKDKEALPYLQRAAELATKILGPQSPDTLTIQLNLAGVEANRGDPLKAAELFDTVVQARTKSVGASASDTLAARYGYFNALRIAKQWDRAVPGFAALYSDASRSLGDEHWLTLQTRATYARTLYESGKAEEALPIAEEAAARFLASQGAENDRTKGTIGLVDLIKASLKGPAPRPTQVPAPEGTRQTPGG